MKQYLRVIAYLFPLVIFLSAVFFLWRGLSLDPRLLPSALLDKPAPDFTLTLLDNPQQRITKQDLLGRVALVHVWATWCETCREEQGLLLKIARHYQVPIYGVNYKDDRLQAIRWLKQLGNPYRKVLFDNQGKMALDWGVYGTPETFIIDSQGIIRYKYVGAMTEEQWAQEIYPLVKKYQINN